MHDTHRFYTVNDLMIDAYQVDLRIAEDRLVELTQDRDALRLVLSEALGALHRLTSELKQANRTIIELREIVRYQHRRAA